MIIRLVSNNFKNKNIENILKKSLGVAYGFSFTYGTVCGYKMAMNDWNHIKINNIKMSNLGLAAQYFHTGFLTLTGGITGCVLLTISPIIIPVYLYTK
jgi:hypothetical protein